MEKSRVLIVTILFSVAMVGAAFWARNTLQADARSKAFDVNSVLPPSISQDTIPGRTFDAAQLSAFNGKNGSECYAAVDGTVYQIEQGRLWKDGEHVTSGGRAYCGLDLSEAMKQSPHGKSKLQGLPIVGTFK